MECSNETCAGGVERRKDCPYALRCNGYIPAVTTALLQRLHFQHEEFPDGWFWFLQPGDGEGMLVLSKAMGFAETIADDLPDTIILQINDALDDWTYVYGAEVGHLTNDEALNVLSNLLNEKTAREEL